TTLLLFFFPAPAPTEIYTLSLHDALPISRTFAERGAARVAIGYMRSDSAAEETAEELRGLGSETVLVRGNVSSARVAEQVAELRSEEHTSELQSRFDLVCRLLLEKKKKNT